MPGASVLWPIPTGHPDPGRPDLPGRRQCLVTTGHRPALPRTIQATARNSTDGAPNDLRSKAAAACTPPWVRIRSSPTSSTADRTDSAIIVSPDSIQADRIATLTSCETRSTPPATETDRHIPAIQRTGSLLPQTRQHHPDRFRDLHPLALGTKTESRRTLHPYTGIPFGFLNLQVLLP